jgi:hypothetical protein
MAGTRLVWRERSYSQAEGEGGLKNSLHLALARHCRRHGKAEEVQNETEGAPPQVYVVVYTAVEAPRPVVLEGIESIEKMTVAGRTTMVRRVVPWAASPWVDSPSAQAYGRA